MRKKLFCFVSFLLFSLTGLAYASTLNVETDYRLRGIDYSHTEIFSTTSTQKSLAYYSQMLNITLRGNFDPGIEICSKLTAVGIVGTTETVVPVPYPNTNFTPYVENAYISIKNLGEWPIDISAGKQNLCYGNGLIACDNGVGFSAIRVGSHYDLTVPFIKSVTLPLSGEFFTAKVNESLVRREDKDIYGGLVQLNANNNIWEVGYFEESDFSGTLYVQGLNTYNTKAIVKKYIDFRVGKKEDISEYQIEIAKQSGYITRTDGSQVDMDGMGYLIYGKLINEKTKVGKVAARALVSVATGDDDPGSFDNDEAFAPTYTKKYDGMERAGYGTIFGATPVDAFFALPMGYSGINTFNIGTDISPVYNWTFSLDIFLFSASQAPKGAPEASGFERFYGAEYSLGSELDFKVVFANSKYSSLSLAYCTYEPPKASIFWPNSNSVTSYRFEISAKF